MTCRHTSNSLYNSFGARPRGLLVCLLSMLLTQGLQLPRFTIFPRHGRGILWAAAWWRLATSSCWSRSFSRACVSDVSRCLELRFVDQAPASFTGHKRHLHFQCALHTRKLASHRTESQHALRSHEVPRLHCIRGETRYTKPSVLFCCLDVLSPPMLEQPNSSSGLDSTRPLADLTGSD